jgi:16S rRNA (cytosine1402-N4)-methyltransferase
MRLNSKAQEVKASDLLSVLRVDQLRKLFETVMDPGASVWLSRRVISQREIAPIKTVGDFLNVTRGLRSKPGLNPATLPMLALRIAVNSELENLKEALPKAFATLEKGGKLVMISFHSGEDQIVKEFFRQRKEGGDGEILTKEVVVPTESEININPRARSAKMRVITKNV